MEAMKKLHVHIWLLLLLVAFAGLTILAGCKDEAAEMAKQQISSNSARKSKPRNTAKTGDMAMPSADATGDAGGENAGEGDEPPAEPEYTGPKVDVNILECKAPYPEFDGKGRYTIKIEVSSQEYLERAVWDILFFNAEGEEVAKDRQELKIPMGEHPMVLKFSSLFCMSKPETIELRLTELGATKAEEAGNGNAGGAGAGGGAIGGGRKGPNTGGGGSGSGGGEDDLGLDD